jgi:hypothetical protein
VVFDAGVAGFAVPRNLAHASLNLRTDDHPTMYSTNTLDIHGSASMNMRLKLNPFPSPKTLVVKSLFSTCMYRRMVDTIKNALNTPSMPDMMLSARVLGSVCAGNKSLA